MKKRKSFSKRLIMNIVFIVSIIFTICIGVLAISSHKLLSEEATKSARNLLNATISDIERELQVVENTTADAVWVIEEHLLDTSYLYHITERLVAENPLIIGSTIAFKSGYYEGRHYFAPYSYEDPNDHLIKSKQLGNIEHDYFLMEFYQLPILLGKPCWTEPYFDEGGAERYMTTYSYPIHDKNGDIYAVITADIPLEWISEIVSSIHPYKNSFMLLVSRAGNFIGNYDRQEITGETLFSLTQTYFKDQRAKQFAQDMVSGDEGVGHFIIDGELNFATFGKLDNGWSATIICQYREVLRRNSEMHTIIILVALFGIILLFLICYFIVKQLTKPILEFSQAAENIAQGNFDNKLPEIKSDDEIKQLRDSLDHMQTSLAKLEETTQANARMASELNIASAIQQSLLSTDFPHTDQIDVNAVLIPAKEVGGDLYDFLIRGDRLYFSIGDVSGKGVPAAIFMAIIKSALYFFSGLNLKLFETITRLNKAISKDNKSEMFVTLFVGYIDLNTGEMTYCNAGHNRLVLVDPDGKASFLNEKSNIAIGVWHDFEYESESIQLKPGTKLILYTDGITEAERTDKEQFGDERLLQWAEQKASKASDANEATQSLLNSVKEFTEGNEQNDDITIMTINFKKIM